MLVVIVGPLGIEWSLHYHFLIAFVYPQFVPLMMTINSAFCFCSILSGFSIIAIVALQKRYTLGDTLTRRHTQASLVVYGGLITI